MKLDAIYRSGLLGLGLLWSCSDRDLDLDDEGAPNAPDLTEAVTYNQRWSCLYDADSTPREDEPIPTAIRYRLTVFDSLSLAAPPELAIDVCQAADVYCVEPLPGLSRMPDLLVRPSSTVELTMPYGFLGYLRLTAPEYVPTDYYVSGPLRGNPNVLPVDPLQPNAGSPELDAEGVATLVGEGIPLQRSSAWDAATRSIGSSVEPDTGSLMIRALDCRGEKSDGVMIRMVVGTGVPWVMRNGVMLPNDVAEPLPTDASGLAGFVNVPSGAVFIEGSVQAQCASGVNCGETPWMSASSVTTRARANTLTLVELRHDSSYGR